MGTLVAPFFNLAVLVGILVYYLRKPLADFVSNRHLGLKEEVQSVTEQLRTARKQFDEFSAKLKAIDAEVSSLTQQYRQDAESIKVRILTEAKKSAQAGIADAQASATTLVLGIKDGLRKELAERVLGRAEVLLRERLTGDDRLRIRREFSKQVGSIQ